MRPGWSGSYDKVEEDSIDAESAEKERLCIDENPSMTGECQHVRRFPSARSVVIFMVATSIGLALILAVSLYSLRLINHPHSSKGPLAQRVCGNTAAEARSLGCKFDQMTWAWLSPSCPRYASDEFMAADDFKYYSDPYNRMVVNAEDWEKALDNQVPLYTERREHLSHCVYTFLSLAQVIRDGTQTHPKLSSYEHIEHCAEMVMESIKRDRDWLTVDADMGDVSFDEGC